MCIGENLLNRNATNSMRNAPLQVICVNQHHDSDNSTSRRGEALGAPFPPTPDVSVSILFYFKPSRNQPRHCNIKRVNMHFLCNKQNNPARRKSRKSRRGKMGLYQKRNKAIERKLGIGEIPSSKSVTTFSFKVFPNLIGTRSRPNGFAD